MINIFNQFKIRLLLAILTASLTLVSCTKEDHLEIQNNFPFEVSVMPIPKEVSIGETVEIRITIQPEGNYDSTQYYLRYFQFDGAGTLQYYNETPYLPNDLYYLPKKQFRLYYTSQSTVSQSFDVWISDHFGNERELKFHFNSSD